MNGLFQGEAIFIFLMVHMETLARARTFRMPQHEFMELWRKQFGKRFDQDE
jgi:hypothetical protein